MFGLCEFVAIFIDVKQLELKRLIKEIIKEAYSSRNEGGEWVAPNGTVHDIGDQTHTEWASDYLRTSERRFSDNPKDEMLGRGWLRVRLNHVFLLIIAEYNKVLTRAQTEHIQDLSEDFEWLVVDGRMNPIYKPFRCKTPDAPEEVMEDHGLGYSHNVSFDDYQKERDPLNDPLLTGKLSEGIYKYDDFEWLGNMAGYRVPSDVRYGSIYLGVIESYEDRYVIKAVASPHTMIDAQDIPNNNFKTKDDAAKMLHRIWKSLRTGKQL